MFSGTLLVLITIFLPSIFTQSLEFDFSIEQSSSSSSIISRHIKPPDANYVKSIIKKLKPEELDLTKLPDNLYKIKLTLGTPPQPFEVAIDTGSFVSWVPSNKCDKCKKVFQDNKSSTYKNLEKVYSIRYVTGSNFGFLAEDKLSINNKNVSTYGFMLCDFGDWIENADGLFGLGRDYSNFEGERFNMISSLHTANIISKKIFSQKIIDSSKGKFYLGDYADEIKANMLNYTSCRVNQYDKNVKIWWNCYLSHLLIGDDYIFNRTYQVGINAVFDTGASAILAPKKLLDYFIKEYLSDLFNSSACIKSYVSYLDAYSFICYKSRMSYESLKPINFIFNGWAYQLPASEIWTETVNTYTFKIFFRGDDWLIGQPFLSIFHMVFDGDNNRVGFFGGFKHNFTEFTHDPLVIDWDSWLLYGSLLILGLVIIILTILYFIRRRKQRMDRGVMYEGNVYYNA